MVTSSKAVDETIFVQIASYRDPELINTVDDLIDKSVYPDRLKICIAHQFSPEDEFSKDIDKYREDERFIILDIHYEKSKGACWARNQIQQRYNDETYTFQLDSHHRFERGWDALLIDMYQSLQFQGYEKPLITSYIPSYNPDIDPKGRAQAAWGMKFDRFTPEGVVFFLPYYLDKDLTKPIRARFYSAHFAFTTGQFCKEVPHDPKMYFHGEEISIAVRAFTHGYDLFHPHIKIAYHEYTRKGRTKHWDDHITWVSTNTVSHERMRKLLNVDGEGCTPCQQRQFGKYSLGKERSLQQYTEYSGIRFEDRAVQQQTLDNVEPPNFTSDPFLHRFKHPINLYPGQFTDNHHEFWAVILEDKDGNQLYRRDVMQPQIDQYLAQDAFNVWVDYTGRKPYKWIIWPYTNKGWETRIEDLIK